MYTKSGVSGMAYANTFQRMEIKYLLTSQQTEAVLQKISGFMIEDEYSRQTVCSLYCDSPDDILARISLDKPVYKEKLRLRAARMVTGSGADMVIANGAHPELLYDIAAGKPIGTRFAGHKQSALSTQEV